MDFEVIILVIIIFGWKLQQMMKKKMFELDVCTFGKWFWNSGHSVRAAMYLSLYYWFSWLLLNRVTALIEFSNWTSMSHCQVQWHCENKICSNCDEVQLQQKVLWIYWICLIYNLMINLAWLGWVWLILSSARPKFSSSNISSARPKLNSVQFIPELVYDKCFGKSF